MVNPVVKKYFLKFGLPAQVLQSINDLVMGSKDENTTDDEILDTCKTYDNFAKSFQSEVDAKIAKARKEQAVENTDTEEPNADSSTLDALSKQMSMVLKELNAFKTANVSKSLNDVAAERLAAAKMTPKEVDAALFGRQFKTTEEVEDFVSKQTEFYQEILQDRVNISLGDGNPPARSEGETSFEEYKQRVEEFNKNH